MALHFSGTQNDELQIAIPSGLSAKAQIAMKYFTVVLSLTSLITPCVSAGDEQMRCITDTGKYIQSSIKHGYSAEEVENVLNACGLKFSYISRDEINKIVDVTPATTGKKKGAEYLVRIPVKKKAISPRIVSELEMIVIKLDYHTNKVTAVACGPVSVGP